MIDSANFGECVMPHLPGLVRAARHCYPGDRERSDDLVQETLARACKYWDRYEEITNIRAWLHHIQYNVLANDLKREKRRSRAMSRVEDLAVAISAGARTGLVAPSAEAEFFASSFKGDLGRALKEMNPLFAQVVVMRDVMGLSYQEITEQTGIHPTTVATRILRGRKQLAALLSRGASPAMDR